MANDGKGITLLPGERETISMAGNKMSFVHREPDSAYSMVEWASEPGAPGSSVHIHRMTDEAFYAGGPSVTVGKLRLARRNFSCPNPGDQARVLEPRTPRQGCSLRVPYGFWRYLRTGGGLAAAGETRGAMS